MNHDIFITCAMTGAGNATNRSQLIPITPRQTTDTATEASNAGAAICHIQVRDPKTFASSRDVALFDEIIGLN